MPAQPTREHHDPFQPSAANSSDLPGESAPSSGGAQVGLLWLAGLAALFGGLAVAVGPELSWQAHKLAAKLATNLVPGAALAVGGLCLIGMAWLRRAQSHKAPNDQALMLEHIAAELALMHEQIDQVARRCDRVAGSVDALSGEVARLPATFPVAPAAAGNEDALFGLASSLDKLGAKLEQRLKAQHQTMQDEFEELNGGLMRTHQSLAEQLAAAALSLARQPEQPEQPEPRAPLPVRDDGHGNALSPNSPLGLLDSLDDDGAAHRSMQRAEVDFAQLDQIQGQLAASAHGRSWEEELQMVEPNHVREKLDQLGQLLADPELRSMLDSLRRA